MCGIFGVVSARQAVPACNVNFMKDAFLTGQVRGTSGTGMFTVNRGKHVVHGALAGNASKFLEDKRMKKVIGSIHNSVAMVGHNRFTTSGDDVDDHCHPFAFGDIVGVHNGGIPEHILKKIDPDDSHDVDSGRLYAAISRVEDPIDVLKQVSAGAYALVWYDKRRNAMLMARNGGRPLHVAETMDGLFFSSELGMLTWLMGRNRVGGITKMDLGSLDQMTLYEIPLDDTSKIKATPYKEVYTPLPQASYQQRYPAYQDHYAQMEAIEMTRRFKTYYAANHMVAEYPAAKHLVERVRSCLTFERGSHNVHMLVTGIGEDVYGCKAITGVMVNPASEEYWPQVLVTMAIHVSSIAEETAVRLIEAGNEGKGEVKTSPIVSGPIQPYVLRPDGDIIIRANCMFNINTLDNDEFYYQESLDHDMVEWVKLASGEKFLEKKTADEISVMWARLRSSEPITDVPF